MKILPFRELYFYHNWLIYPSIIFEQYQKHILLYLILIKEGGMDVAVLSQKSNLSVAHYRQRKNGTVEMGKIKTLIEAKPKSKGMNNKQFYLGLKQVLHILL